MCNYENINDNEDECGNIESINWDNDNVCVLVVMWILILLMTKMTDIISYYWRQWQTKTDWKWNR